MKTRSVNLSAIPEEKRQEAWERLQEKYPDQAALLQDPMFIRLRETFGGEVSIDIPVEEPCTQ